MAERDIVGGMFGITPEMYQRSMAARDTATNANLAALAPGQLAGFYAMEAGTGLGRAAQGLLGVEDPELMKIRDVQQMRTQFDVSTPAGLTQFAQALGQKGYTDLAMQAAQRAADLEQTVATTGLRQAQAEKALRGPAASAEQLLTSGRYTPASVAKYQASGNIADLVLTKEATGGAGVSKPLPASLQKSEDKDLEAYDSYSSQKEALMPSIVNLTPDAEGVRKLELGPLKNAKYIAQNLAGNSSPESRAFEALRSAVGTAVNLQVSAEKGVQTDKDVLRFADALIAAYGKNDTQATLEALKRYYDSINRAQEKAAGRVESRRKSQNVEPYFQGQAVPQVSASAASPASPTTQPQAPKTIQFKDLPASK
jgi:hypothetical protein